MSSEILTLIQKIIQLFLKNLWDPKDHLYAIIPEEFMRSRRSLMCIYSWKNLWYMQIVFIDVMQFLLIVVYVAFLNVPYYCLVEVMKTVLKII